MNTQPTLHFTQIAILRTLAAQTKAITVAEVAAATNAANPKAQTSANNVSGQLRLLAAGRYVASCKWPGQPMLYSISQQGRALLADNPSPSRSFCPRAPAPAAAPAAPLAGPATVKSPYRTSFLEGAYTCPELRTPPPRGEASLAPYRLPSRGLSV